MKIGILGTGRVAKAIGGKLSDRGHEIYLGSRDVERTRSDATTGPLFDSWHRLHTCVKLTTLEEAAAQGELVVNATDGTGSLAALRTAGKENLGSKVLIDIANPLDWTHGTPPSLTVCNTDSLGEQIQRAFPDVKVVKALNTVHHPIMVSPPLVGRGDHTTFLSGNDGGAKATVAELLRCEFGWRDIVDLGDITTARATEMVLLLWAQLSISLKTPMFNLKVIREI